jgi:protein-arginine kinase activator protein McsA
MSPDEQVILTCPECLRTFPQTLDTGWLRRKTDCIYCYSTIHYAILPAAGQMSSQPNQRRAEQAERYQLTASNYSR